MKNYGLEELRALEFEEARFRDEGDSRGGGGGARDDHAAIDPDNTSARGHRPEAAKRVELREEMVGRPRCLSPPSMAPSLYLSLIVQIQANLTFILPTLDHCTYKSRVLFNGGNK